MSESGDQPSPDRNEHIAVELFTEGGKVDPDAVRASYLRARESGDDEFLVKVQFEIARASLNTRLDKYLTTRVTYMSRSQLQSLLNDGGATVNGRVAKSSSKIKLGDQIELVLPQPASGEIEPDDIPLTVLFEDAYILVLNKQPNIIVHPARAENRGTLLNALVHYFQTHSSGELSTVGEEFARPGVVHRLDRNTSGCMVIAKSDQAHWKMGQLFQDRKVDKRYLAIVEGWVEPDSQLIDLPLGPHLSRAKGSREKRVVRHDDLGKPSKTVCRVRERYALPPVGYQKHPTKFSLVELELLTGRTHQIRVHLSHIGYPIVGDDLYGGKPLKAADGSVLIEKQSLHAALLAFDHPITHEPMTFIAPPRDEVRACIDYLRAHGDPTSVDIEGTVSMARFGLES